MKLSPIKLNSYNVAFKQKIIDSHIHIGHWYDRNDPLNFSDVFSATKTVDGGDSVEKIIVSNLDCMFSKDSEQSMLDEIEGNVDLLKKAQGDKRIAPLATCQPKTGSVENIKKLFNDNPDTFVGLKFHPDQHKIEAPSGLLDDYLKFAQSENLPCVFHCGLDSSATNAIQYSHPEKIYQAAKKIPNTPVIMAHLGAGDERAHEAAIKVLVNSIENNDAKLFADISWVDINTIQKPNIIKAIKALKNTSKGDKTGRLLFGSDAPLARFSQEAQNYGKFVREIKEAIKNDPELSSEADELIDKIFYKNADELFFKGIKKNNIAQNLNTASSSAGTASVKSKGKLSPFVALAIALGTIVLTYAYRIYKNHHPNETK